MTKIMVVEDDQSLREIYSIRLTAEGYEVVSAGDGEEALAIAVKEKPDLIVSDVMMPKISGFDMLDILRSTPETKDVKVIMMTALSSEDQRKRGESLGADKYLVKSQVGIEDVINSVKEVLAGGAGMGAAFVGAEAVPTPTGAAPAPAQEMPVATPAQGEIAPAPAPSAPAMNQVPPTPVETAQNLAPAQTGAVPMPAQAGAVPTPTIAEATPTPAPVQEMPVATPNEETSVAAPTPAMPVETGATPTPAEFNAPSPATLNPAPAPQVPNNGQQLPTNPAQ